MENDQNMNNNDPLNTAGSDNSNNTNTYVRADDTAGDADVTRLAQRLAKATRAQPMCAPGGGARDC